MRRLFLRALFEHTEPPSARGLDLKGIRVLLVDDDPVIVEGLARQLQRRGCTVRRAMDVATALEILDTSVDVAILDWMLIGGTCEPILAQIHRDVLPCGVILFSALATTQPAMAVARYREVAFVSKPCAAAELLPYIRVASALADARRGTFTPEILADVPSSPADVDSAELLFKVIEGALQRAGDLSPRVLQVLSCYLRGAELKAFSRILGISDSTVRTSIQTARDRCGAESNAEFLRVAAVQLARELRWKKSWPVPGEDA